MQDAYFQCSKCANHEVVPIDRSKIFEPDYCNNCKQRGTFQLIHNRCMFSDKQFIKLQETPESVPEGETPQTLALVVHSDNVDSVKPGDRVEAMGIYRAVGVRVNSGRRTLKNLFRTHIDVICFIKSDKKRYAVDTNEPILNNA
jgi:DNA replication licensing factor MCM4